MFSENIDEMDNNSFFEKLTTAFDYISDILSFMFLTIWGYLIILALIIIGILIFHGSKYKDAWKGSKKGGYIKKLPSSSLMFLGKIGAWIASNIITIFIFIAVIATIIPLFSFISGTIKEVQEYFNLKQELENLEIALENLSKEYKIGKMEVLEIDKDIDSCTLENGVEVLECSEMVKVKLTFYSPPTKENEDAGEVAYEQIVQLPGREILLDFKNLTFEYSRLEQGDQYNLAYPVSIFTSNMRPADAIAVNIIDPDTHIPAIYSPQYNEGMYGLSDAQYSGVMRFINQCLSEEDFAREKGVRSISGKVQGIRALEQGQLIKFAVDRDGIRIKDIYYPTLFD